MLFLIMSQAQGTVGEGCRVLVAWCIGLSGGLGFMVGSCSCGPLSIPAQGSPKLILY